MKSRQWQRTLLAVLVLGCCVWLGSSIALAQPPSPTEDAGSPAPNPPKLIVPGIIGADSGFGIDDGLPKLFVSARFELEEGKSVGRLLVKAEPSSGWHTYSITQKPGGPQRSEIKLASGAKVKFLGPLAADTSPEVHEFDFWPGVKVEEHRTAVTWSAPIEFPAGVDPRQEIIDLRFEGQVCKDMGSCVPIEQDLKAKFSKTYTVAKATGEFQASSGHVRWTGHLEPQAVTPGGQLKLVLTATPEGEYHAYPYATSTPKKPIPGRPLPTLIALKKTNDWGIHQAKTAATVTNGPMGEYHSGPVTWEVVIDVPETTTPGVYELTGLLGFQTCSDRSCDLPEGAEFRVSVAVAPQALAGELPLAFTPASYDDAEKQAQVIEPQLVKAASVEPMGPGELLTALGFALLGGLILNFMPCVLPVIGLKVIQFAEQAGQSRAKVLALNLTYAAGLLSVFLVLATLAVFLNLGWGEHFGETWFQVLVTGVVFAMGISFLGVWEIPIPGFVATPKTSELQHQEGLAGAFFKGIITTILATPCSGPFLGSVFGLTLSKPPYVTYLIFTFVGLGMALPYLVIGAFPSLVRWVPKPGAWMETLKQLMGFALLGTVVYLFATISEGYRIATLTLIVGIWFACWMIGKVPAYAEFRQKATAWVGGVASAAIIGWAAFTYLGPHKAILPWQDFSMQALAEARAKGQTVMLDFTASWCPTCHMNYKFAIDTLGVKDVVERNGVIPMIADWSDRGPLIKQKLEEHGSKTIPFLVVYPGDGGDPIILRDVVLQSQVIAALEKAGPSQGKDVAKQTKPSESKPGTKLSWTDFSPAALKTARAEGKTVLVDFVARWEPMGMYNHVTAVDTNKVKEIVERNGIVSLLADYTEQASEIKQELNALGSQSIPLVAVYPADGRDPIVLRDILTEAQVFAALEKAGPSRQNAGAVQTSRIDEPIR